LTSSLTTEQSCSFAGAKLFKYKSVIVQLCFAISCSYIVVSTTRLSKSHFPPPTHCHWLSLPLRDGLYYFIHATGCIIQVFLLINTSNSGFITVSELSTLFTNTLGIRTNLPMSRKIMAELDIDNDGCLCFIDMFTSIYLAECYLHSLGSK